MGPSSRSRSLVTHTRKCGHAISPTLIIAVTVIINTTASTTSGRSTAPLLAFSILSLVEGQCKGYLLDAHQQTLSDFHWPFQRRGQWILLSIEHLLLK